MTLVFIHGAAGTHATWHLQLLHFEDTVALDLPGHPTGSSYRTIGEFASFIEQYLRTNKLQDPVLVGHSMGGAIAIELALFPKAKLSGLVLVGTGARLRVHPDILSKITENYKEASELLARWSVSPSCDPVITARLVQEILKIPAEVAYGDFLACNNFDRMDEVEKIAQKTLIICGADDRLTPPKYSEYLHEKILDSKLVVIPGAGHSVMLEKHRLFNDALREYLDSL